MVIPKSLREKAGLQPGVPLEVRYRDGRIEIEPATSGVRLVREGRFLVADAPEAPALTREEVVRLTDEDRRGRALSTRLCGRAWV